MQPSKRVNIVSVKLVKKSSMLYRNRRIRSPQDIAELFREYLGEVDRKHFIVACLNTKNQSTNISTVHIGSINASIVHPEEVMKTTILSNAASILCCHPHPSGYPIPSSEDIEVTERIFAVGKIIGSDVIIFLGEMSFLLMHILYKIEFLCRNSVINI
ncbi:JAB domain-containing protein [Lysinibacillus fusiformis]|uniref:JAB domain-containing protein n=1 Tax=Lysinibacillus fusiformis TaxID=28031 RepID=UPI00215B1742|nr:JAB domain-containing protein [Lysinibacillus fusiformis]MCR8855185.1 JAB domain-containing protein [Lysinibacillus fusiformis]